MDTRSFDARAELQKLILSIHGASLARAPHEPVDDPDKVLGTLSPHMRKLYALESEYHAQLSGPEGEGGDTDYDELACARIEYLLQIVTALIGLGILTEFGEYDGAYLVRRGWQLERVPDYADICSNIQVFDSNLFMVIGTILDLAACNDSDIS